MPTLRRSQIPSRSLGPFPRPRPKHLFGGRFARTLHELHAPAQGLLNPILALVLSSVSLIRRSSANYASYTYYGGLCWIAMVATVVVAAHHGEFYLPFWRKERKFGEERLLGGTGDSSGSDAGSSRGAEAG